MTASRLARACVLLLVVLLLAACGKKQVNQPVTEKKPVQRPITLTLRASDDVNPGPDKAPSSVVVRVYQLTGDVAFNGASYDDLFQDDKSALKEELVDRVVEMTLRPGEQHPAPVTFSERTKMLGVVAFYRDSNTAKWSLIIPLPLAGDGTILVGRSAVSFTSKLNAAILQFGRSRSADVRP